jgi:hypothetical protein
LVILIGMVGLVVDGGLMMASHRHAHNAADAAALAAALEKLRGQTDEVAIAMGQIFVRDADHNDLPTATTQIHIPPTQGPYAGSSRYAEAIVTLPTRTFFLQVLPGITERNVQARAVAGFEFAASGEGVLALNCEASPGLKISGNGSLVVEGDVIVNSHGGGVDENGNPVDTGGKQTAITVNNNGSIQALNVDVVGGVNNPDNFENYVDGDPNPLHTGQTETPDPFMTLPTPSVSNGVVDVSRGAPQVADGSLALNNPNDSSDTPNFIETDPVSGDETMVLHPGIYDEIKITGGRARFVPGIYVLRPTGNTPFVMDITGGEVDAEGVMFYNARSDYNPINPAEAVDYGPCGTPPTVPPGVFYGDVKINAAIRFAPIDTGAHSYIPPVATDFNGMLFYQARDNPAGMQIEGDSDEGDLTGTLYAKWADVKIAGQGAYDAQFVVGSMEITGGGDVTISYDGSKTGKAPRVFLVE